MANKPNIGEASVWSAKNRMWFMSDAGILERTHHPAKAVAGARFPDFQRVRDLIDENRAKQKERSRRCQVHG